MRQLKITPFTIGIAVVGIAVLCDSQTVLQITYWSDNEGLWRHAAEVTKNNYVAYGVLGLLEEKRKDYAAAVVDLEKSLKSRGDRNDIRVALGVALRETHRTDEAISNLYEVVSLQQTNVTARKELALALIANEHSAEALTNLTFALKIDPENQQLTELVRSLTNAMPLSHTNESATETNHGFAGTGTQGQLFRPAAHTR
jgi:tetratricopeptide (TPR) repeat protein